MNKIIVLDLDVPVLLNNFVPRPYVSGFPIDALLMERKKQLAGVRKPAVAPAARLGSKVSCPVCGHTVEIGTSLQHTGIVKHFPATNRAMTEEEFQAWLRADDWHFPNWFYKTKEEMIKERQMLAARGIHGRPPVPLKKDEIADIHIAAIDLETGEILESAQYPYYGSLTFEGQEKERELLNRITRAFRQRDVEYISERVYDNLAVIAKPGDIVQTDDGELLVTSVIESYMSFQDREDMDDFSGRGGTFYLTHGWLVRDAVTEEAVRAWEAA